MNCEEEKPDFVLPPQMSEEYELISAIKTTEERGAYLLYDKACSRKVLLKTGDADTLENEARLLSKLSVRGIPQVYRCFEHGGKTFLLRQYISGKTLRQYINEHGRLSVGKAVEAGIAVCEIIAALHKQTPPIIHRDIKSDNIIITPDGEIYVIDFGISREYDDTALRDTQVMGTPLTAPPEQFGYSQTDARSDVYALGVLLNELVTGSVKINLKALPRRLAAVVKRCTQFSPEKRYENCGECRTALLSLKTKSPQKFIVAALSVIAAAAVFCCAWLYKNQRSDRLLVLVDSVYPGDYIVSRTIPLNVLRQYSGDVKITLDVAVENGCDYANFMPVAVYDRGGRWENLDGYITTQHSQNYDGFIELSEDERRCTFILSKEAFDVLGEDGIGFQSIKITVKSAELSNA